MAVKIEGIGQVIESQKNQTIEKPKDTSFRFEILSKIDKSDLQGRLQSMIDGITEQGEKIAEHTDIRDMRQYREKIKEFINEIVSHSHEFSRDNFLDRRGRHRVYGIVKLVDKNLDDLAQELLKEEKNRLTILSKVGEIKGLLLDMIV